MAKFKHLCMKCKKNYLVVTYRDRFPVCYDCLKPELSKKIKDPKMAKMFNIKEDYYKENSFLRSIKLNHIRYGELSDKQIETFKKVVQDMKDKVKEEKVALKKTKKKKV